MHEFAVRAVIFDFDGTLTLPGAIDFYALRSEIGCPPNTSLMEFIEGIGDPAEQKRALEILEQSEIDGAERSRESPNAAEVIRTVRELGLRIGIMTNNSRKALDISLSRFSNLNAGMFDLVLSREDAGMKPDPDPMLHAAEALDLLPEELIVVGDYLFDVRAGNAAGAVTVFLSNGEGSFTDRFPDESPPDHEIESLRELETIIRCYLPLPEGKVPNDILARILDKTLCSDPDVVVGPGIGRDAAVIRVPQSELVVASDPITLISSDIGEYALTVNANDIAASGADPRWFLATILLPMRTTAAAIEAVIGEISTACGRVGVCLCGGHTEVTGAVTRTVVSGTMLGLRDGRLGSTADLTEGDALYMTKGVGIEGTAIIASSFRDVLIEKGVDTDTLERAASYRNQMSVVAEAKAARRFGCVMHDVTEGGIATAVREFSIAVSRCVTVDLDSLPISRETEEICAALDVDPLGLIGSGSLLLGVAAETCRKVERAVGEVGVEMTKIGTIGPAGHVVSATRDGAPVELPHYQRDELARLLSGSE